MSDTPILDALGITSLEPRPEFKEQTRTRFIAGVAAKQPGWLYMLFLRKSFAGALALFVVFLVTINLIRPNVAYASSLTYLALASTYFHEHSGHSPFEEHDGMILLFDPRIVPAAGDQEVEITYTYGDPDTCPNYVLTPSVKTVHVSLEDGRYQARAVSPEGESHFSLPLMPSNDVPVLIDPQDLQTQSSYSFNCQDDKPATITNTLTTSGNALTTLVVSHEDGSLIYRADVTVK